MKLKNLVTVKLAKLGPAIAAAIALGALSAPSAPVANAAGPALPSTSIVPASDGGTVPSSSASTEAPPVPAMPPVPPPPASAGAAAGAPPEEEPNPPPLKPSSAGAMSTASKSKAKVSAHHVSESEREVEPAKAELRLVKDDWVFAEPSKWSKHIERVHSGKLINVAGSTRYYLQVKLKSGETGYLDPSAVDITKATDKIFTLTRNAEVLEKPNKWSKKVSEVHRPHPVHVVGIALNYAKIRMKNGTEGYIPLHALE
jgi:hypothetical protein